MIRSEEPGLNLLKSAGTSSAVILCSGALYKDFKILDHFPFEFLSLISRLLLVYNAQYLPPPVTWTGSFYWHHADKLVFSSWQIFFSALAIFSIFSIRLTINTSFKTSKYKLLGRKSGPLIKGYFMLLKRKIWVSKIFIWSLSSRINISILFTYLWDTGCKLN